MKLPREIKNWINRRRSARGKSNGVIKWLFDNPKLERMIGKNEALHKRRKQISEGENNGST